MKRVPMRKPSEFELSCFILGECTHLQKLEVQNWINSSTEAAEEFTAFKRMIADIKIPDTAIKFEPEKTLIIKKLISCFSRVFFKPYKFSWALITILVIVGAIYYKNNYHTRIPDRSNTQNISVTRQPAEPGRLRDTLEILISTCRSIIQKQQIQGDFSGVLDTQCMNRFHSFNQIFTKIESLISPVRMSSDRTSNLKIQDISGNTM